MKLIISLIAFGFFIISCHHEEFDIHTFGDRRGGEIITDSLGLSTNLVGSWIWTEEHCQCCAACSCVESSWTNKADQEVAATFYPDNTFSVSENGSLVITGNWSVQRDTVGFLISLANQNYYNHYFSGSVNISDNQMLADSFSGCKQLFLKK